MTQLTIQYLVGAINHNADLLQKHLNEGVYVHRQTEPNSVWSVKHSLGSLRPLIETFDTGGNRIGHAVNRTSQTLDSCAIVFAIPVAGTAILRF